MQNFNLQTLLANAEVRYFITTQAEKTISRHRDYTVTELIEETLCADDINAIHTLCVKIRKQYGFDFFSFYVYIPRVNNKPLCYLMRDYVNEWAQHYSQNNYLFTDPSIRYSLLGVTPKIWRPRQFYNQLHKLKSVAASGIYNIPELNLAELKIATRAYDFGMQDVTCFPIHGTQGDHGVIRFAHDIDGLSPHNSDQTLVKKVTQLSLLVTYVYEMIIRVLTAENKTEIDHMLSPRESEILSWAAQGKSSWDISQLLRISEHTVQTHFKNIHAKLGVQTRQHAIAKAMSLKLITL